MAANPLGLIETSLVEGVVLVWACWELWSVRKRRAPPAEKPTPPPASPEDPGHAEGQHGPHDG
jgi:hypothetical protein